MTTLPNNIKQVFIDTLCGDTTVIDFEQWLYADSELETVLNAVDYYAFISFDYRADNAKAGLFLLLEKYLDRAELETQRIRRLLTKALNRDNELPEILKTFYDLNCKGYGFLENLGMEYGLRIEVPGINDYIQTFDDLNREEQTSLLESFYPGLETEIGKVIDLLDTGKIVLTGNKDENERYVYEVTP